MLPDVDRWRVWLEVSTTHAALCHDDARAEFVPNDQNWLDDVRDAGELVLVGLEDVLPVLNLDTLASARVGSCTALQDRRKSHGLTHLLGRKH